MESAASERAVIIGGLDAGPATILFAVTQPERTAGLVLFNTTARLLEAPDYPIGYPPEVGRALVDFAKEKWGTAEMAAFLYPERAGDEHFCIWYSKFQRAAASPRVFAEHMEQTLEIDVREYLPLVQAPTLVMMRPGAAIPMTHGHYLAERIPGAQFVELPGRGNGMMGQHVDQTVATLREFLTGAPSDAEPERVLATILFTDIVDSTGRASAAGDRRWREFLDRHERTARAEVVRFRGRFVGSTGDGILATFDTPTRAVRCAFELAEVLRSAGIEIRAGVHTGEIELRGEDVAGIGVHIAARTIAEAGAGEVVVTRTVRDLATGTNLTFISRGSKKLRGIPDEWELFDAQLK